MEKEGKKPLWHGFPAAAGLSARDVSGMCLKFWMEIILTNKEAVTHKLGGERVVAGLVETFDFEPDGNQDRVKNC